MAAACLAAAMREDAITALLSRTGRRRNGRGAASRTLKLSQPDHPGYRRHLHRCLRRDGRQAATHNRVLDRWATSAHPRCSTLTPSALAVAASSGLTKGGMLRVGPHSAGADPGPVLLWARWHATDHHGRASRSPDDPARGVPRRADDHRWDGGAQRSSRLRATSASSMEAADSAVQLANANIVRAIQLISTERGRDPRDYVLVPFWGRGTASRGGRRARPAGIRPRLSYRRTLV